MDESCGEDFILRQGMGYNKNREGTPPPFPKTGFDGLPDLSLKIVSGSPIKRIECFCNFLTLKIACVPKSQTRITRADLRYSLEPFLCGSVGSADWWAGC